MCGRRIAVCVAACVAVCIFFLAGVASGQDGRQLPVGVAAVHLAPDALERLTRVTPNVATPLTELAAQWRSPAGDSAGVTLQLTFTLGPSWASGEKQTTLVGVSGTLEVPRGRGRGTWAVEQDNFRRFSAYADYVPGSGQVVFLLPVAFERPGAAATERLHALLLIPCHLQDADLTCESPRRGFLELVQRSFPGQRPLGEVLPFVEGTPHAGPGE